LERDEYNFPSKVQNKPYGSQITITTA